MMRAHQVASVCLASSVGCALFLSADFGDKTLRDGSTDGALGDGDRPPGVVVALGEDLNTSFSILAAYAGSAYVGDRNGRLWRIPFNGGGATPIPIDSTTLRVISLFIDTGGVVWGGMLNGSQVPMVGGTFDPSGQGATWLVPLQSLVPDDIEQLALLDSTHVLGATSHVGVASLQRSCSSDGGSTCSVRILTTAVPVGNSGSFACLAVAGGYVFHNVDAFPYAVGRTDPSQTMQQPVAFGTGPGPYTTPCVAVGSNVVWYDPAKRSLLACDAKAPAPCPGSTYASVPGSAPSDLGLEVPFLAYDGNAEGAVYLVTLSTEGDGGLNRIIYRTGPKSVPRDLVHAKVQKIAVDDVAVYWLQDFGNPNGWRLRAMAK